MDFRDVTALIHGSAVEFEKVVFSARSIDLRVARAGTDGHLVVFRDVEILKWKTPAGLGTSSEVETVGLEKLGAGEVWRLYIQTVTGAELELSCRTILCDGADVTGVGRSYRH